MPFAATTRIESSLRPPDRLAILHRSFLIRAGQAAFRLVEGGSPELIQQGIEVN
jgi:hypothetical protein